tara:strand:+ start:8380 stop:8988 length:609 start_codon:yes stop_codon:yes gene_type:complete
MSRSGVIKAIKELAELHNSGILTDEEFQAEKTHLLGRLREEPLDGEHEDTGPASERFPTNVYSPQDDFDPYQTIDLGQYSPAEPHQNMAPTEFEMPSFSEQLPQTPLPNTPVKNQLTLQELRDLMPTEQTLHTPEPTPPPTGSPLVPKKQHTMSLGSTKPLKESVDITHEDLPEVPPRTKDKKNLQTFHTMDFPAPDLDKDQ